jgi:tetratricopeptide (TPR) repeat protein
MRIVGWSLGAGLPGANDDRLKRALKTQTQHALCLQQNKFTLSRTALALSLGGQTSEADTLARELRTEYQKDTLISDLWLPMVRAALELQNGKPEEAIESLATAERFESAAEFCPQYLRGLAYLGLDKGAAASIEFHKIIAHRGEAPLSALYSLAHLGAGRALALIGEFDLSRKAYEEFLELWKDADADMPSLAAAQSEYKQL